MTNSPVAFKSVKNGLHTRVVSQLTRNTFAMVLAGGRGSRLHELTDWRSKPAVPFGGQFRIIDFTLSNCVNSGVRHIGVATQYKAQSLIRHIHLGWNFLDGHSGEFLEIMPAQQQVDSANWYLGTADAVYQNLREIALSDPEYVLVLSGDHIYRMDYGEMLAEHFASDADLTVACIHVPLERAGLFGVMAVDAQLRVVDFEEKPVQAKAMPDKPDCALASMGVYAFKTKFLVEQLRRDAQDPLSSHDFGKDLIPHCVRLHKVQAYHFQSNRTDAGPDAAYWRDVGTLDAYWDANMDLIRASPKLNLYDTSWPIWTWQSQLPPAKFVHDEEGRRGVAIDSMVGSGTIISGATVRRSMLFDAVRVHSFSLVEDSILLPEVVIGRRCVLKKCIVDRHCVLPDDSVIGIDAVEDRRRFHVTPAGVTLVTRSMLGQNDDPVSRL